MQTDSMDHDRRGSRSAGGAMLALGGVLFIVTIGFELAVGWLDRDPAIPIGQVIAELWPSLKTIWAFQMTSAALIAGGALILLSDSRVASRWWPTKVLWVAVVLGGAMATAGYSVTLSAYPAALAVLDTQPELFDTLRGAVAGLYRTGISIVIFGLGLMVLREGIPAAGVVSRKVLAGLLAVIGAAIALAATGAVTGMHAGAVVFLMPVVLGASYWVAARQ